MSCCSPINARIEPRSQGYTPEDGYRQYCKDQGDSRLCKIDLAQYKFDFDDTIGWEGSQRARDLAERYEPWSLEGQFAFQGKQR